MTEQTTAESVQAEIVPIEASSLAAAAAAQDKPKKDKEKKKKKKERSRGIETMFRVTYSNHIALSRLADTKTSMLISINSLIISGVIAIVTRTGTVSWHFAPVLALLAGCLISLGCAVSAARPRVHRSRVDVDDIRNNTGNLLFFAQFTSMSLPQFQESVQVLMKEPDLLYDHLARQLYHMGESLNRKYRYLQLAYSAFLVGIAVATVLLAFIYFTGGLDAAAQ